MNFPKIDPSLLDYDPNRTDKTNSASSMIREEEVKRALKMRAEKIESMNQALTLVQTEFPRIFKMIKEKWSTPELHWHLTKMLVGDVENRKGFPEDVANALMTIYLSHMDKHGFKPLAVKYFNRDTW